jgi:uncharacterized repeat protein (TIGR02059 family)
VGKKITVAVAYTDAGNSAESVSSAETAAVGNINDKPTGAVTITGTQKEGKTLTADTSALKDADGLGSLSYQWQADGKDISGATNASYTLTQAEVGKKVTVVVSYTDGGNSSETVVSIATDPVIAKMRYITVDADANGAALLWEDTNKDGVKDDNETTVTVVGEKLQVNGTAVDLAEDQVTIRFRDFTTGLLDLTGFGADDKIIIDQAGGLDDLMGLKAKYADQILYKNQKVFESLGANEFERVYVSKSTVGGKLTNVSAGLAYANLYSTEGDVWVNYIDVSMYSNANGTGLRHSWFAFNQKLANYPGGPNVNPENNASKMVYIDFVKGLPSLTAESIEFITPSADAVVPKFVSAQTSADGAKVILTYSKYLLPTAGLTPDPTAFAVQSGAAGNLTANTVTAVHVTGKTVELTLANAIANGQEVVVAYTDPTDGDDRPAIQNLLQKDAASLPTTSVINNVPPDTTAPTFVSAATNADGSKVILTYSEDLDASNKAATSDFDVKINDNTNAVTAVAVSGKTVELTLTTPISGGQTVTVSYTDPTSGNDAQAIQDAAGNDVVSLSGASVTNNVTDTSPPTLVNIKTSTDGKKVILTYSETLLDNNAAGQQFAFEISQFDLRSGGNQITIDRVDAVANTIELTVQDPPIVEGQTLTLEYTANQPPIFRAIYDLSKNPAASFTAKKVTNLLPDTIGPVLEAVSFNHDTQNIILTFNEVLDANNPPPTSAFTVTTNGTANAVKAVAVSGNAVTLTVTTTLDKTDTVQLSYADPSGGNDAKAIQDATGNDAASFNNMTVQRARYITIDSFGLNKSAIWEDTNRDGIKDAGETSYIREPGALEKLIEDTQDQDQVVYSTEQVTLRIRSFTDLNVYDAAKPFVPLDLTGFGTDDKIIFDFKGAADDLFGYKYQGEYAVDKSLAAGNTNGLKLPYDVVNPNYETYGSKGALFSWGAGSAGRNNNTAEQAGIVRVMLTNGGWGSNVRLSVKAFTYRKDVSVTSLLTLGHTANDVGDAFATGLKANAMPIVEYIVPV